MSSSPEPLYILRGHIGAINNLKFINYENDLLLCSGDSEGVVKVWNMETRRAAISVQAHEQGCIAVEILQDGSFVSQGKDGVVKIWDMTTQQCSLALETHSYTFHKITKYESHRDTIFADPRKGKAALSDALETFKKANLNSPVALPSLSSSPSPALPSSSLPSPSPSIEEPSSSTTSHDIASLGTNVLILPSHNSSEINVFDLRTRSVVQSFDCEKKKDTTSSDHITSDKTYGMIMCTRVVPPNEHSSEILLACGMESGHLAFWSLRAGKRLFECQLHNEPLTAFSIDESGINGLSGSAGNRIVNLQCREVENQCITLQTEGISEISIRGDEKIVACAGWDRRVRLYAWKTLKPLAVLQFHTASVYSVAFAPMSSTALPSSTAISSIVNRRVTGNVPLRGLLATGSKDRRIAIYNVYPS